MNAEFRFRTPPVPAVSIAALTVAVAILSAGSVAAAPASFDCTKARNRVERAICADAGLSASDVAIAAALADLLRRLDLVTAKILREDQIVYLRDRDAMTGDGAAMARRLAGRVALLTAVDAAPRQGLTGRWANTAGRVTVTGDAAASRAEIELADPNGTWSCRFEGSGTVGRTGLAFPVGGEGWTLRLVRKAAAVVMSLEPPKGTKPDALYPGCLEWGTVASGFLPVR